MTCCGLVLTLLLASASWSKAVAQEFPAWGEPFHDADHGTVLYRVTNATDTGGGWATQIYSQLQAFSPDNEFILLIEDGLYVVRRFLDHELVSTGEDWNAPRWHYNNNNQSASIIHYDSNEDTTVRVLLTNVESGEISTLFTFPSQYDAILNSPSFDELSLDGRWMAGAVLHSNGTSVIFALDLVNSELTVEMGIQSYLYQSGPCEQDPVWGIILPDWIGVSPLGNFLMVQWSRDGTARCSGLESYNISTGEYLGHAYEGHQHGDLGASEDGLEYFMTTTFVSPQDNNLPGLVLHPLPGLDPTTAAVARTVPFLFLRTISWGDGTHISCRGPPGICAISTSETIDEYHKAIYLQFINGTTMHLAKHQSSECGYWVQPRASISRDGEYVIFASDWAAEATADSCPGASGYGAGEAFVVETNLCASTLLVLPSVDDIAPSATPLPNEASPVAPPTMQPDSLGSPPIAVLPPNDGPIMPATGNGSIIFRAALDGLESILDLGGTTNLREQDFVTGHDGQAKGANFQGTAFVSFPLASVGGAGEIDLNRGSLSFWYKPSYAANEGSDESHCLILVGDVYNPPSFAVTEADTLQLRLTDPNWQVVAAQGVWRAPLWSAGEWVLIEALWDNTEAATRNLSVFVNGRSIGQGVAADWDLGTAQSLDTMRIGACDEQGTFSASGVIEDVIVRAL